MFSILGWLLFLSCWIWPIIFVQELLACIKAIVRQEEESAYQKHVIGCTVSLMLMLASTEVTAIMIF